MEITEVGVRIVERSEDRLKAVCTMTIDDSFVVRDIKVVEGQHGLFVAMPSRKRTMRCPQCGHKNEVRSRFCNECGVKQAAPNPRPQNNHNDRSATHSDVAHPINTECREMIQEVILQAYKEELEEYLAEYQGGGDSSASGEPDVEEDDRMQMPRSLSGVGAAAEEGTPQRESRRDEAQNHEPLSRESRPQPPRSSEPRVVETRTAPSRGVDPRGVGGGGGGDSDDFGAGIL